MGPELAVTCGDPAGVGPEIIAGWLAGPAADVRHLTVIGPAPWLATLPDKVKKIAVGVEDYVATPGEPTGESALVAWAAMERAAEGCRAGEFGGVVTGPVSKAALARIGYIWPGQTEFFAARWGGDPVMAFCGGRLRVVLATWHVPRCEVPQLLGPQLLHRTIAAADTLARAEGITAPRIGVCGLNPHAGENGLFGDEEDRIIRPAITMAREAGWFVEGPFPADTLFRKALQGHYDGVVAMYHDQGLIPVKLVAFESSCQMTLGIPMVRTSVDHGTAFDIAGQNLASPESMKTAIRIACEVALRNRELPPPRPAVETDEDLQPLQPSVEGEED